MAIINGTAGDDDLFGTPGSDQINGFAGNDRLFGEAGNDILDGGDDHDALRGDDGDDILLGGNGDDFLRGDDFGVGDDILNGGAGWDRATYAVGASAGVTVDLNIQGVAQDTGSKGLDTLIGIEHLTGTAFSDVLTGNRGDNWLWGGSDTFGATGDDVIIAGGGNDLVEVGTGNHTLDGGTGVDSLSLWGNDTDITAAGVTVSLLLQGAAQDTEQGMMVLTGFENLSGSKHADGLTGDGGDNMLAGDQGNDFLAGGDGIDTLYGDGRIIVDTHDTGGSGPITIYADIVLTDPANLVSGDDTLEGGLGDDVLNGGGGSDTASYANASGGVFVGLGAVNGSSSGADGDDLLIGIENVTGSAHDDQIIGNNSANVLSGGSGHDYLRAAGGDDSIFGGGGDDYLGGGFGDDLLDGGAGWDRVAFFHNAVAGVSVDLGIQGIAQNTGQGMDTLVGIEHASGTELDDVLTGNGGDNWLWGEGGNDVFTAGGGNDLIEVGPGNAIADGGSGTDSFSVWNNGGPLASGVALSLALQGGAQATSMGSMTLTGFENLSGTSYDDVLSGDGNANVLAGDVGDDTLSGGANNDTLYGDGRIIIEIHTIGTSGPIVTHADVVAAFPGDPELVSGDDTLEGGLGNDLLNGGGGSDTASYANALGAVFVNLATGISGGADGNDTLVSIENVMGSAHEDNIQGNGAANVLDGGDGHDFMRAHGGNDSLIGGLGDDYLDGGLGDDSFDGGAGWDRISYAVGAATGVTVDLNVAGPQVTGHGTDTISGVEHISGTKFDDTITGDGGDNWLWGGSDNSGVTGNDAIAAGGGNDLVWAGSGNHVLDGGAGIDTFGVGNDADAPGGVTVSLALQGAAQASGHGSWTLSGFENLSGTGFDDSLTGDGGDNLLAGSLGNDTLYGGSGNDTIYGDGVVTVDTHGGGGSGPIVTYGDYAAFLGVPSVPGNDILDGGDGDDVLDGGGGTDTASYASASGGVQVFLNASGNGSSTGAAGNDSLVSIEAVLGSAFDDQLVTAAAASRLSGGGGNDLLTGQNGADTLEGEEGHDQLRGNNGNDILRGGDGDDFLAGGNGDDTLDGGAGWDRTSFFSGATAGVTVDLNIQGVAQNTGRGMDTLIGIEHTSGTAFDDVLTGNGGDNWLWGDPTGNDTLAGNGGNDLLWVGVGNHVVSGGSGTDTLGVNATDVPSGVTWSLALQGAPQATGHGTINISGVENLSGSEHADSLTGDGGANVLAGALGNDSLSGGDGNDILYGDGAITIDVHGNGGSGPIVTYADLQAVQGGVSGDDVLVGGKGDDIFVGGGGNDVMTGGQGDDLFIVGLGSGDDRITDMGKKDLIAIVGVAGVDDFSDLVIVNDASGKNAVVSWHTGDSVTLEGVKANKVTASMFAFEDPTAPAAASFAAASAYMAGGGELYTGDPGFGA